MRYLLFLFCFLSHDIFAKTITVSADRNGGFSIIQSAINNYMHAAIWHDGSAKETDKSVLINCRFTGNPGFKLGRNHREAQMYLIDCSFSKEVADAPVYQERDRKLQWGQRIYFKNCHRDDQDYAWFADNTALSKKVLSFTKVFGSKW